MIALPITLPIAGSTSAASARTKGNSAGKATSICCRAPAPPGGTTTRSTISRRSIQSRRSSSAGVDTCDGHQITDHFIEAFGLVAICPRRSLRPDTDLIAVAEQGWWPSQGFDDNGAVTVRNRRQQRIAHALGFGRSACGHHFLARQREARSSAAAVCSESAVE